MFRKLRFIGILMTLIMGFALVSATQVEAGVGAQPSYGSATVDGDISEWNIADPPPDGDFFSFMRKSGSATGTILGKLYVRYECGSPSGDGTVYVLVLSEGNPPYPVQDTNGSGDEIWVKLNGTKVVSDADDNDGTPPDFAYVMDGGGVNVIGWEASFSLPVGGTFASFDVHNNVFEGGESQTAEVPGSSIDLTSSCFDLGDLPDTYTTTNTNGGAKHVIQAGDPILGELRDGEADGVPTGDATGDGADEDGIEFETISWGNGFGSLNYRSSDVACLNVWIDFANADGTLAQDGVSGNADGNGFFDHDTEHVVVNLITDPTDYPISFQNVTFNLPYGSFEGTEYYVRARLTPLNSDGLTCGNLDGTGAEAYAGGVADPNGLATGGEVEDYLVPVLGGPTAITLTGIETVDNSLALLVIAAIGAALSVATGMVLKRRNN